MALVVVGTAKGAPGGTTAALALAALWPRPVVMVDCDPSGGDVVLRLPSPSGSPLNPDRGLVSLAAAGRNGMSAALLLAHTQPVAGGLDVLAGLRGPEQAAGLDAFWPALAGLVAQLPGIDVVVDAGRFGPEAPTLPLLRAAHLVLLVTRPVVTDLVHARARLGSLVPLLRGSPTSGPRIGVLLRAPAGQRDTRGAREALTGAAMPPDRLWQLADDPRGVGVFEGRAVRRPERTDFVRSVAAAVPEIAALVAPFHLAGQPLDQPFGQPAGQPFGQPAGQPPAQPARHPTAQPAGRPAGQPAGRPAAQPAGRPAAAYPPPERPRRPEYAPPEYPPPGSPPPGSPPPGYPPPGYAPQPGHRPAAAAQPGRRRAAGPPSGPEPVTGGLPVVGGPTRPSAAHPQTGPVPWVEVEP